MHKLVHELLTWPSQYNELSRLGLRAAGRGLRVGDFNPSGRARGPTPASESSQTNFASDFSFCIHAASLRAKSLISASPAKIWSTLWHFYIILDHQRHLMWFYVEWSVLLWRCVTKKAKYWAWQDFLLEICWNQCFAQVGLQNQERYFRYVCH